MTQDVPTSENSITVELVPEESASQYDAWGNSIGSAAAVYATTPRPQTTVIPASSVTLVSPSVNKSVPKPALDKKIICFDVETTGTLPWDYRVVVCGFWDLSLPISESVTFAGWDEEQLTKEIADYLNTEKPDALLCYNNGFDQRALLSRFMLYQIPVPGWNDIEQIDLMQILQRGTTKSIYSSQPTGTEEQWLKFLFNEEKPYTIDECFEGIRNGDLTRMILRNKTCVESEGSIYLLFRSVTDIEPAVGVETKPTAVRIEEAREKGVCLVECAVCGAVNDVPCDSTGNRCWRCMGAIPDPTEANRIRETLREVDYSRVGLKSSSK